MLENDLSNSLFSLKDPPPLRVVGIQEYDDMSKTNLSWEVWNVNLCLRCWDEVIEFWARVEFW